MQDKLKQTLWLLLGGILSWLTFGTGSVAIAAWLAPVCLLRFVHLRPTVRRVLLLWPVLYVALLFANWDVMPVPGAAYFVVNAIAAGVFLLVYFADRAANMRIRGFAATLVFPAAPRGFPSGTFTTGFSSTFSTAKSILVSLPSLTITFSSESSRISACSP